MRECDGCHVKKEDTKMRSQLGSTRNGYAMLCDDCTDASPKCSACNKLIILTEVRNHHVHATTVLYRVNDGIYICTECENTV